MRQRRDRRQHVLAHRITRDQQVDRLEAGGERGVDEVLALGDEQTGALALRTRCEPAVELQARVGG
jgi:hypothetical protein